MRWKRSSTRSLTVPPALVGVGPQMQPRIGRDKYGPDVFASAAAFGHAA
ncbi:hypothetical protein [Streptomyces sp. NRRL S-455]|nr:hypothetical protein [Streptomyces sp. NRRL S-455]